MKFLANENIPWKAVDSLRAVGIDVDWVAEIRAGASDREVLDQARREGRILITFDKDFGELAFRDSVPGIVGVILLRFRPESPEQVADTLIVLLASERSWEGFFSVVSEGKVRMVPLPSR